MRHAASIVLLLLMPVLLPGCLFYGLGCDVAGAALQSRLKKKNVCVLFGGDCCGDTNGDERGDCGSLIGVSTTPCGRVHNTCDCVSSSALRAVGQALPLADGGFTTYDVPPFTLRLGLEIAGASPAHQLVFDVVDNAFQTFQGVVTYSAGFGFNGFTALGPANTTIGSYGADLDLDGTVDLALPLRAASATTAYVDVNGDDRATAVDPTIEYVQDVPTLGAHTFNLLLPDGGDTVPNWTISITEFRAHVRLDGGILVNPLIPGAYDVSGTFTSVDQDTGGASNGSGFDPFNVAVPPVIITIVPSPLTLVDHFLCYRTKPSAGNICNAAATTNAGGLCASDAECGAVGGACVKNAFPKGVRVGLGDEFTQFSASTVDIKKPVRLCTPADKNGEGPRDDLTHLRGYQILSAPRASQIVKIANQLGTVLVAIRSPDSLLVPAAKALGAPAAPLGAHAVDHYQCYKAKVQTKRCAENPARLCKTSATCGADGPCLGKFAKGQQVAIADQFTPAAKRFDLVKPTRLCSPAVKDGEPINSPGGQLLCYRVTPAAGQPVHAALVGTVHTTTQLGRDRLNTVAEDEVCIPSLDIPQA